MKKKLMGIIILILLSITINVSATTIYVKDIPTGSYVIGNHLFTRKPYNGVSFSGDYDGTLKTKYLMLGSTSIDSINPDDMIIYYKNPDGILLNAVTDKKISNVPDSFEIEYVNAEPITIQGIIKKSIATNTTSTCNNLTVEENGTTYLSGTKDCINFNYVWYSGKLWRITAINPDGTMKMITDDLITTISYGEDVNFYDISKKDDASYTGSYIYQWLNEDFLDTLYNYKNIIVENSTWNITNSNAGSIDEISKKLPETTLINNSTIGKNTSIGLLNSYEYYLSYKNTSNSSYQTSYLNIGGYNWWLLNPYNASNVWIFNEPYDGVDSVALGYFKPDGYDYGVRPTINLKSTIQISGGSGTKDNPYKIVGDKDDATVNFTLLNTRSVGEYVVFDEDGSTSTKEIYRIVEIDDQGKVKLNKNDYIKSGTTTLTKAFSTSEIFGNETSKTDDYWDYYLNKTWYINLNSISKNMIVEGKYYTKSMKSKSYKDSLCDENNTTKTTKECTKTTSIWSGYVGLPRYGEMFASQQENGRNNSTDIWFMTPNIALGVCYSGKFNTGAVNGSDPKFENAARPSIYLKSNVVITGGDGTKTNPFTIALK